MTIQDFKQQVTQRDLETKSVFVDTTLLDHPLRVIAIGRRFLSIMHNDGTIRRVDPIIVTGIRS